MNFDTPHLLYIAAAYGVSLAGLCVFMGVTWMQWRRSQKRLNKI